MKKFSRIFVALFILLAQITVTIPVMAEDITEAEVLTSQQYDILPDTNTINDDILSSSETEKINDLQNEEDTPITDESSNAVSQPESVNTLSGQTIDPANLPRFESELSEELIPAGWVQYPVIHEATGEVLYWTLKPRLTRTFNSVMTVAPVTATDVYIYLDKVENNGQGFTYANNVVTVTGGNYNYLVSGSTTTKRIEIDTNVTATLTLCGVTMSNGLSPIILRSGARLTLYLPNNFTNTVTTSGGYEAGILAPVDTTLTIEGASNGTLNVTSSTYGAAIGGNSVASGNGTNSGTININGGIINVTSNHGAGIGGGYTASGKAGSNTIININGGVITATSNGYGAGIGGGGNSSGLAGDCGTITINNATVTAKAGNYGAGIGGGGTNNLAGNSVGSSKGSISINHSKVTSSSSSYGAGIGSGLNCAVGDINIEDSDITVTANNYAAGIGSGHYGTVGEINIKNSRVTVTATSYGAGIGGGHMGSTGNITIKESNINASNNNYGAAIGSAATGTFGDITIDGGDVTVSANAGAAIGNGSSSTVPHSKVSISNCKLKAYSKTNSAILSSNVTNAGSSYIVNGLLNEALSTAAVNLKAYSTIDQTDLIELTLPAGYRGFAFTGSDTAYSIETTNLTGIQKLLINYHKNVSNIECGKTLMFSDSGLLLKSILTSDSKTQIIYHANGGSNAPVDNGSYACGAQIQVMSSGSMSKSGYTFKNWNTKEDGTGINYAPNQTVTMRFADITLYAIWESGNVNSYTVIFAPQGGTAVDAYVNIAPQTTIALPASPTRTGYSFSGWYKDELCTTPWDFSNDKVIGNTTLFAKWTIEDKEHSVEGISVSPKTNTIFIGENCALTATAQPDGAVDHSITWISSNPAVATVDANGIVTGVSDGFVAIMARTQDGTYFDFSNIIVKGTIPVTGITAADSDISVEVGNTYDLVATVSPSNAQNKNIIWKSSAPNIVSVNYNGQIKALQLGTAVITAVTEVGNFTVDYKITVKQNGGPVISENLAFNKAATSNSESSSTYSAKKAVDGNPDTRWLSKSNATETSLEIDLGQNTTFNQVKLNEFESRINSFAIEYWDGANWMTAYIGSSVGQNFVVNLPTITASKIRLLVYTTKGTYGASIYEFEVYNIS